MVNDRITVENLRQYIEDLNTDIAFVKADYKALTGQYNDGFIDEREYSEGLRKLQKRIRR